MSKDAFLDNIGKVNEVCRFVADLAYRLRDEKIKAGEDLLGRARAQGIRIPPQLRGSSLVFVKSKKDTRRTASRSKHSLLGNGTAPSKIVFYYPRGPHPNPAPGTGKENFTAKECTSRSEGGHGYEVCYTFTVDWSGVEEHVDIVRW